jgi:hypothetical protein
MYFRYYASSKLINSQFTMDPLIQKAEKFKKNFCAAFVDFCGSKKRP